ncbi:MAG: PilZ domain-containing protein [Kofleriaceae bacterium]|nr:PilZ domain-containing protein [Myxococcales bacterium]MCB9559711.1 PilZ domain-containing protein [Kofleriaceae bacterium]MCB9573972.1 PilZ domain-containing protein [Kofleriaceae bacterium]
MRLLTLAYPSASAFLTAFDEKGGTLLAVTKTEATLDEQLLVEIAFPKLPNRPLLRARCVEVVDGGLKLRIDDDDASTREFLVRFAKGEVRFEDTKHREHKRFPSALPVEYRLDGRAAETSVVEDLSAGGCFVRSAHPPDVGLAISVSITVPEEPPIALSGHVAWVRAGKGPGFGIEFEGPEGPDGKRLRQLIRKAIGTGDVDL